MKNHEQLTIKYLDTQKREDRQAYALPRGLSRQSTCLVSVKSERRMMRRSSMLLSGSTTSPVVQFGTRSLKGKFVPK